MPKDQLRDAQGGTPALDVDGSRGMDDTPASIWLTLEARAASPVPWCCGCSSGFSITLSFEIQELKWHERRYLLLHLNTRLCHPCRALRVAQHLPPWGHHPHRVWVGAFWCQVLLSRGQASPLVWPLLPGDMLGPRCPVLQLGHRQWKKASRVMATLWRRKWRMEKKTHIVWP